MDTDEVWRTIDQQRAELADLMETFTPEEWETPSLCERWRVREVAAHLTLAHMSLREGLLPTLRAHGSFDGAIHLTAVRQAELPVEDYPRLLRRMLGSRRTAPFISDLEPLIDVLVHEQDMVVPLGRSREMPRQAAAVAAARSWKLSWPFKVRRRLGRFSLVATDHDWSIGSGPAVEGRMQDLLMVVTGRDVVLPDLSGPGADSLRSHLAHAA